MARGRPLLRQGQPKVEHHRPTPIPPNDAGYVQNWALLEAGERVHILQENGTELIGQVDAVTDDGAILWLQLMAGAGRKLFSYSEGGLVWRATVDSE